MDIQYFLDNPDLARSVLTYVARTYGAAEMAAAEARRGLEGDTFALQRDFIVDDSESIIACRTGRRGGKTTAIERKILRMAVRTPKSFSAYIALTRRNAKLLLWPELLALNDKYNLGGIANVSDLTLRLPNDHLIVLGGADNEREIEKYRQFRWTTAAVDEAGTFGPWLQKLVEDILEPATIDAMGQILLCGTPGPVCEGYYFDVTGNPETPEKHVKQHRWTILDNEYIPHAARELERIKKKHKWADDHPTYMREYKGLWVPDHTMLAYYFAPEMMWDGVLPQSRWPWEHTLSVDVGYDDPTAFALTGHNREVPAAYVRECHKIPGLGPTEIADRIDQYCRDYNVTRIVADLSGGTGKGQIKEWQQRFRIPLTAPPRKDMKKEHITLMNDDAKHERLYINTAKCGELIREFQTVCWLPDRSGPDPKYANDCLDAVEYGWASSLHFAAAEPPKPQQMSQAELYEREERELQAGMQRSLKQQRRRAALRP